MISVNVAFKSIFCRTIFLTHVALVSVRLEMLSFDVILNSCSVLGAIVAQLTVPGSIITLRHVGPHRQHQFVL